MPASGIADYVGRVFASRYRLRARIGTGGSGQVFVADDISLARRVAVKVLHPAFASDSTFLSRFRAEARVAASLHHPNVLAVYDWGEDTVPYMVMELLEGGSLASLLEGGARLSPAQAAHVGRQVCAALEYAHGRGLVHRDIKPGNLLFDEHAVLRVADFGLARALAESSLTEPDGAVVGTPRYASPEQAAGTSLDARADLYALALVLVEAVTGTVPHAADTAMGTLRARSRGSIMAPTGMGLLGPIVERAGRVDREDRFPDAAAMGAALDDVIGRLPPPRPLPLRGLKDVGPDTHPTAMPAQGVRVFDQDASDAPAVAPVVVRKPPRRPARSPARVAPFVMLAVIVLVLGAVAVLVGGGTGAPSTPVPLLSGRSVDQARTLASRSGLLVRTKTHRGDDPAGLVMGQAPVAGAWTGRGSTVTLVVSLGPPDVPIPAMAGLPSGQAQDVLVKAGFVVTVTHRYDEQTGRDGVLSTQPTGHAPPGSAVTLAVSDGPAPVNVPQVPTASYDAAAAALSGAHLTPAQAEDWSDTVPAGQVISISPAAGQTVARSATVTVTVSKGPHMVTVPPVQGLTLDGASAALQAQGLGTDLAGGAYAPGKKVKFQDPAPGTSVRIATTITLYF